MKKSFLLVLTIGFFNFCMVGMASATIVTSLPGGTVVPMLPIDNDYFGGGPISFGPGIIWSSTSDTSVFGFNGLYGFGDNGSWDNMPMAGLNSDFQTMIFEFSSPVMGVGGFLNYAPYFESPLISVYDSANTLMESFVLDFLTGGGYNTGMFFGFIEDTPIKYFTLSNAFIGISNLTMVTSFTTTPVPESSTMILLGFGLIGLAGAARKKIRKITS